MLRGVGITKYERPLAEQAAYEALTPTELERLEAREHTWRGAPEWAIREEMERAIARATARRAMRRPVGRRRRAA